MIGDLKKLNSLKEIESWAKENLKVSVVIIKQCQIDYIKEVILILYKVENHFKITIPCIVKFGGKDPMPINLRNYV